MNSMVRRVLRNVCSAEGNPAAPATTEDPKVKSTQTAPLLLKYYYFEIPVIEGMSVDINFSDIENVVDNTSDPKELEILKKKLKGFTGHTDNFSWTFLVVKTNNFNNQMIVYQTPLGREGAKKSTGNRAAFYSDGKQVEPAQLDAFEDALNLFKGDVVNLDTSVGIYIKGNPPTPETVRKLLSAPSLSYPADISYNYDNFIKEFSGNYRIYDIKTNSLLRPDFSVPNEKFKGSTGEVKALELKIDEKIKNIQQTNGDTMVPSQEQEGVPEAPVSPVQPPKKPMTQEDVREQMLDRSASMDEKNVNIYSQWTGGFDIMQRIYYDQKKNMKIRKEAEDVLPDVNVLKEQANIVEKAKKDLERSQRKAKKPGATGTPGTKTVGTPPIPSFTKVALVRKVMSNHLNANL